MNALDLELRSRGDDVTLAIASRLWAQRGLSVLPEFLDMLTRHYGAPLAVADFATDAEAARGAINGWVKRSDRATRSPSCSRPARSMATQRWCW